MFNLFDMLRPLIPVLLKALGFLAACKALKYCIHLYKMYRKGRGIV